MNSIKKIYLIWRKGRGESRIAIGVIERNSNDGVSFSYLPEGIKKAQKNGFIHYVGFPNLEEKYTTNVIETFGQRIVKSERNDLQDFYDFWKVDLSKKEDLYYMLAQTQGLLATDNFEFLADFYPTKELNFISEITGLSHNNIQSDILKVGDKLRYEREKDNKEDNEAVKLYKGETYIGRIKLIHSKVVFHSSHSLEITVRHIEKNGTIKRAFIEIKSV